MHYRGVERLADVERLAQSFRVFLLAFGYRHQPNNVSFVDPVLEARQHALKAGLFIALPCGTGMQTINDTIRAVDEDR